MDDDVVKRDGERHAEEHDKGHKQRLLKQLPVAVRINTFSFIQSLDNQCTVERSRGGQQKDKGLHKSQETKKSKESAWGENSCE